MVASTETLGWAADYPLPAIVAGLVLLVAGADLLVRGAVWIALALGLSRMTVGLTLVAMGTSMPELLVSFTAARTGHEAIAMANVIGSNTANVLLIVGVAAAIRAIRIEVNWLELGYMLLATLLAGLPFVLGGQLSRPLAGVMVAMLVVFCAQLLQRERRRGPVHAEQRPRRTLRGWAGRILCVLLGLSALAFGAEWLVAGSVQVARWFGLTEALIGMTIVAVGTSLPELATSAVAAWRGQPEISVGNIVGSNIFNVGCVLGIAGLLAPFPVDRVALGRLMVATLASALLLVFVLRVRCGVSRPVGWLFLLGYAAFLAWEAAQSHLG